MKQKVFFSGCIIMFACVSLGRSWESGNFTVALSDVEGNPITNAIVTVKSSKGLLGGRGCDDEYNFTSAKSDEKGIASVDFKFCVSHFVWQLETPSHYSQRYFTPREFFKRKVVESDYRHIDTNTVDGLTKWRELKRLEDENTEESIAEYLRKFEPKSVTYTENAISRSLKFFPKKNPQPMYAYGEDDVISLPSGRIEVPTNGYTVIVYPQANVDLKNNKVVRSDVPIDVDQSADFLIEQYLIETNGVYEVIVRIKFADGCGAYKAKRAMDDSFPTLYVADTNAEFVAEYEFSTCSDSTTDELISQKRLLHDDECLVLRTRKSKTEDGVTDGWHYSKILGPICVGSGLSFRQSVFNPRLNDPNLEFDMKRNLASPKSEVMWP